MTIEHIDPKSYEKLYTYFQDGGDFSVAFVFYLINAFIHFCSPRHFITINFYLKRVIGKMMMELATS